MDDVAVGLHHQEMKIRLDEITVINRAGLRYSEHHVTMKKAGRAPAIVASRPQDFMAKLAALVPAPRLHLTRFHEILAPAAKWRPLIVPNAATFQRRNYFVF